MKPFRFWPPNLIYPVGRPKPVTVAAAAVVLLGGLLIAAGPARAATTPVQVCGPAAPLHARCLAELGRPGPTALAADGLPAGFGPADLQSAYQLPTTRGAGQTIAIVDAFGDANAEADLAVYRQTFGLPPCTTANGCFHKLDQRGGTAYPSVDPGWAVETSLDLDMVSAACPLCHIVLVEGDTSAVSDLGAAEDTAAALGVAAISNSYGLSEGNGMQPFFPHWQHPGTTIVASSGDFGYTFAQFPALLPNVLAVGGTSLARSGGKRGWTEQAWSGAGSGCSAWIDKPAWQTDKHCHMRTIADVSAVADPNTGVAVYDSTPYLGHAGWSVVGGTSAAAPLIAGVVGLAENGNQLAPGYAYGHTQYLNDVVGGSNVTGWSCNGDYICTGKRGYDGPTGLGTPAGLGAF
jgi:subtilase family serine protease